MTFKFICLLAIGSALILFPISEIELSHKLQNMIYIGLGTIFFGIIVYIYVLVMHFQSQIKNEYQVLV